MSGVPTDLDLGFPRDAEVVQVCFGRSEVQVHFHPEGTLAVEATSWGIRRPS